MRDQQGKGILGVLARLRGNCGRRTPLVETLERRMLLSVTGGAIITDDHTGQQVEGQTATLDVTCTTDDGGAVECSIDFGDISGTSFTMTPDSGGSYFTQLTHAFPGEAGTSYDVNVLFSESLSGGGGGGGGGGGSSSSTYGDSGSGSSISSYTTDYTVTITDAPVSLSASSITWPVGTPFATAAATLCDSYSAASASDFTGTIDWGDGQTSAAAFSAVDGVPGQFLVEGTHVYTAPESVTATVHVSDVGATSGVSTTAAVTATPTEPGPRIRVANFNDGTRYNVSTDSNGSATAVSLYTGMPLCVNIGSTNGTGTQDGDKAVTDNYGWDFGDTISMQYNHLSGFNAAHIYDTAGTYHVALAVTSRSGAVSTAAMTVTVSANPDASSGHVLYVDSLIGNDSNDGTEPSPTSGTTNGPLQSIAGVVSYLNTNDPSHNGTYSVRFADGELFTTDTTFQFRGNDMTITDYASSGSSVPSQPVIKTLDSLHAIYGEAQPNFGIVFRDITFTVPDPSQAHAAINFDKFNGTNNGGGGSTDVAVVGCRFFNTNYAFQFEGDCPQIDPSNVADENPSNWDDLGTNGKPKYGGAVLMQDNYVPNPESCPCWVGGHDWTILGNDFGGGEQENVIRCDDAVNQTESTGYVTHNVNGFINVYANDIGPGYDAYASTPFEKSCLSFRGNTMYVSAESNTFRQTEIEVGNNTDGNVSPNTCMICLMDRNTFIGAYIVVRHPTNYMMIRNNFFESPTAYGTDDATTGVSIDSDSSDSTQVSTDIMIVSNTMASGKQFFEITKLGHTPSGTTTLVPHVTGIVLADNLSCVTTHAAVLFDVDGGPTSLPNKEQVSTIFASAFTNIWGVDGSTGTTTTDLGEVSVGTTETHFTLTDWAKVVPGGPGTDLWSQQTLDSSMLVPASAADIATIGVGGGVYDFNGYRRYVPTDPATDVQTAGAVDRHSPKAVYTSQDIGTDNSSGTPVDPWVNDLNAAGKLIIPGSTTNGSFGTDFNINAGGHITVGATSDSFRYVYGILHNILLTSGTSGGTYGVGDGSFDVKVNVLSVDNGTINGSKDVSGSSSVPNYPSSGALNLSSYGGIMARGGTDAGSGFVYIATTPISIIQNSDGTLSTATGSGIPVMLYRGSDGEVHSVTPGNTFDAVAPGRCWLRLQRDGTTYYGYVGTADSGGSVTWTEFGSVTLSLTDAAGDLLLGLAACSNDALGSTSDPHLFAQNVSVMFRDFSNYYSTSNSGGDHADPQMPGLTSSGGAIGSTSSGTAAIDAGYQALEVYGGGTGFTDSTPGTTNTSGPASDSLYYVHTDPASGYTPVSALNGAPIDVMAQISFLEPGMPGAEAGIMLRAATATSGTGSNPLDASAAMVFGYVTPQGTNSSGNNYDEAGVAWRTTAGTTTTPQDASVRAEVLPTTGDTDPPLNYPEVWIRIKQTFVSGNNYTFQIYESRNPGESGGWVAIGGPITIDNMVGFDLGIAVASGSDSASSPNLTDVQVRYVTPSSYTGE
jgi:hypothetical protein